MRSFDSTPASPRFASLRSFSLGIVICLSGWGATSAVGQTFDLQVMPLLTQAGCNTGACHGAAVGRGGFRLSLYGQDPALDYDRIVRELQGRRVNPADPESSLLLRKAGEFMEHGGGLRLDPDGPAWQVVRDWIAAGCDREPNPQQALVSIHVEPNQIVADAQGQTFSLQVIGELRSGETLDLTERSRFDSQDKQAVSSETPGRLTIHRPGRHVVIARVRNRVAPVEVILPVGHAETPDSSLPRSSASRNFIDDAVNSKLDALRLTPAASADDRTFLRRISLDLTGRIPTTKEIEAFVASGQVDKRTRLIDRLLATDAAIDYWTYWLAGAMRLSGPDGAGVGNVRAAASYHRWLRQQLVEGRPLPEMAAELLTAEGDPSRNGAVGFYLSANDARRQAELFSEVMLGARMRCANCHDHPLDQWTQEDYHGLAAIFAGVQRTPEVRFLPGRSNIHPGTGDPAIAKLPAAEFLPGDRDHRSELAGWLIQHDSGRRLFARAWVNRVWAALMGRGLVDPIDDHRLTNPPTHPELLEELVDDWRVHRYDLMHLIRRIAISEAYGRSGWDAIVQTDRTAAQQHLAEAWYACRKPRPLPTAVLLDAIADVTEVAGQVTVPPNWAEPLPDRAVQLFDVAGLSAESGSLGSCEVGGACDSAADLQQKLSLLCGPLINRRVSDPQGWIGRQAGDPTIEPPRLVDELFLRCLGRPAQPSESRYWTEELHSSDRTAVYQDLAWSLLNCQEFTTNH